MSAPFTDRTPLAVVDFTHDRRNLAEATWPDVREALCRWHFEGKVELWRGDVLVDPTALRRLDELVGVEMRVFDSNLAYHVGRQYGA